MINTVEIRRQREAEAKQNFFNLCVRHYGPGDDEMGTENCFGRKDPIHPAEVGRTLGVNGVIASLHGKPPGAVWTSEEINALKSWYEMFGLDIIGIESVAPTRAQKLGEATAKADHEAYCETVRNLGAAGIKLVTYNWMMPDWVRTNLRRELPDGSYSLSYCRKEMEAQDLSSGFDHVPGWDRPYTAEEFRQLWEETRALGRNGMFDALGQFLDAVIPTCESAGVVLAQHPADPAEEVYGIPRIMSNAEDLKRLLDLNPSKFNTSCFCSGAFGSNPQNNITEMIRTYGKRFGFVHLRYVEHTASGEDELAFHEARHTLGPVDEWVEALYDVGFRGPLRPDHGREFPEDVGLMGYGLKDRILQAAPYLYGLGRAVKRLKEGATSYSADTAVAV